MSQDFNLATPE